MQIWILDLPTVAIWIAKLPSSDFFVNEKGFLPDVVKLTWIFACLKHFGKRKIYSINHVIWWFSVFLQMLNGTFYIQVFNLSKNSCYASAIVQYITSSSAVLTSPFSPIRLVPPPLHIQEHGFFKVHTDLWFSFWIFLCICPLLKKHHII